jgi:hypothetical protein
LRIRFYSFSVIDMTSKDDSSPTASSLAEVRAAAKALALPFTEAEIAKIGGAVASLRVSAERLRLDLQRSQEPAFGFRHPSAPGHKR